MMNSCTISDHISDGMFLGLSSQKNIPSRVNNLEFRFALHQNDHDHEMVVMVDPYVLTQLCLSILFWVLPITPDNHHLLNSLMKHMHLSNSFSTKVTGEKESRRKRPWLFLIIGLYNIKLTITSLQIILYLGVSESVSECRDRHSGMLRKEKVVLGFLWVG